MTRPYHAAGGAGSCARARPPLLYVLRRLLMPRTSRFPDFPRRPGSRTRGLVRRGSTTPWRRSDAPRRPLRPIRRRHGDRGRRAHDNADHALLRHDRPFQQAAVLPARRVQPLALPRPGSGSWRPGPRVLGRRQRGERGGFLGQQAAVPAQVHRPQCVVFPIQHVGETSRRHESTTSASRFSFLHPEHRVMDRSREAKSAMRRRFACRSRRPASASRFSRPRRR